MAIQNNTKPGQADDFLRIQDLFYLCAAKWQWFVLSLLVAFGIGYYYLLNTSGLYSYSGTFGQTGIPGTVYLIRY